MQGAQKAYTTWPAYRVSQGELRTFQWRLYDCFRQQRFPELKYGSDASIALTMHRATPARPKPRLRPTPPARSAPVPTPAAPHETTPAPQPSAPAAQQPSEYKPSPAPTESSAPPGKAHENQPAPPAADPPQASADHGNDAAPGHQDNPGKGNGHNN